VQGEAAESHASGPDAAVACGDASLALVAAPLRGCFRPLSLVQKVVMTVSEYEERFRPPTRSVHQAYIGMHGPKWSRRRRWRLWIAAALLSLMTATMQTASHRTADTDPGQGSLPLEALIRWISHRGIDC
jgi:hypothetical protein